MANLDHLGLNRYIYMTSDTGSMTIGSTDLDSFKNLNSASFLGEPLNDSRLLLGINLYRNGPYGFCSWKQIRVSDNPVTKRLKKDSKFAILGSPKIVEIKSNSGKIDSFRERNGAQLVFEEPVVVSNHKPLIFRVGDKFRDGGKTASRKFDVVSTFNNDLEYFTNDQINEILNLSEEPNENYNIIKEYYLKGALNDRNSPLTSFESLIYRQTVFPKQKNMYRGSTRKRTNFYFPWNDDESKRHKSWAWRKWVTGSVWPLDVDPNWATNFSSSYAIQRHGKISNARETATAEGNPVYGTTVNNTASFGILQQNFSQFSAEGDLIGELRSTGASRFKFHPSHLWDDGPLYSRRHGLVAGYSVANPSTRKGLRQTRDIPEKFLPAGEAYWDVPQQSEKKPFFNSYEEIAEDIAVYGKDHTIIPEYRMSNHVASLVKNGVTSKQSNFLDLNGAASDRNDSSKSKFFEVYSTTEFLKNFDLILEDHKDFVAPSVITLKCKAIKKFVPYEGFYPAQRTVSLYHQFTSSYGDFINTDLVQMYVGQSSSAGLNQALYTPVFAPGVLFNTIKSGIACDYPVLFDKPLTVTDSDNSLYINNATFDYRVPFESLISPEEHLSLKTFINNEVHLKATRISSSAYWNGAGDSIYRRMANNFVAEASNFFLAGGGLSTIASAKESSPNFGVVREGNVYGMRVRLYRTKNAGNVSMSSSADVAYEAPQDITTGSTSVWDGYNSLHPNETLTMYSRPSAFGPPCAGQSTVTGGQKNPDWWANKNNTSLDLGSRYGRNFPFTPPYYHGQAWADIEFRPTSSRKFSLAEIIASSTIRQTRFIHQDYYDTVTTGSGPQSFYEDRINRNAMQITASINLFIAGKLPRDNVTTFTINDQADSRWIIQTKFETPVLNFKSHASSVESAGHSSDVTVPNSPASASVPIGMWHQYGVIPEPEEGVFMQLAEIPDNYVTAVLGGATETRKSLIEICGFNTTPKKIGDLAGTKRISEAVVAVPFVVESGEKKFFRLNKEDVQKGIVGEYDRISQTVSQQIKKMRKFLFPPQIDFVNFPESVDPFAMYIFDFHMDLEKQDLADIWQNIMPSQSYTFETSESSITHPLLEGELLQKDALKSNIRWLVFKVKQRAKSDYYDISFAKSSPDDNRGEWISSNTVIPESINDGIQYNWPYDFFSIVELAKMECEIEFTNLQKDSITGQITKVPVVSFDENAIPGLRDEDFDTGETLREDAKSGKLAEDAAMAEAVASVTPTKAMFPNNVTLAVQEFNVYESFVQAGMQAQQAEVMVENFNNSLLEYAGRLPAGTQIGQEEFGSFVQEFNVMNNVSMNTMGFSSTMNNQANNAVQQNYSVNNVAQGMQNTNLSNNMANTSMVDIGFFN